ncbi:MAG: DUF262 domain-containing protein [Dokdonella sp.]|nr:DUF262 domain-containing protein [Dokdonella sp.]
MWLASKTTNTVSRRHSGSASIVPDYQREYVWTDKEVHQLLEDIGEQIDAGTTREYFIGTDLLPIFRASLI